MKPQIKFLTFVFLLLFSISLTSAQDVGAEGLNIKGAFGLDKVNFFGSTFMTVILMIVISVIIIGLLVMILVLYINAKKYKFRIPLYTKIGNVPTRVSIAKAKSVPFGRAGDVLWFVKGKGFKKWISPATIQSAKNEFWHWIREDGEWVNFAMEDLDDISKKAGVKYVKQEARLVRLGIERLLEQRLSNKTFWEKWGVIIGYVIFFLIITIALVIFFHQYGKSLETTNKILEKADTILGKAIAFEGGSSGKGGLSGSGLVPVNATISASFLPLIWARRKNNGIG